MFKAFLVISAGCLFLGVGQALAQWQYEEQIDAMTDRNNSFAYTEGASSDEWIIVRCNNGHNSWDILVSVGEFIGDSGNGGDVIYRVDDSEPVDVDNWRFGSDHSVMFAPYLEQSNVLEDLKRGAEVLVQIEDYRGGRHRSKFSLEGANSAIDKLPCI